MPRVSVVLPAYEPGPLLERAVESVRAQTMADLELIVVDDGSTQDLSWAGDLGDPRVRLIRQDNAGVSVARNVGVLHARSDLVAFLDQDDEWLPTKLERQWDAVRRQPGTTLCHTGFEWVWPDRTAPADVSAPVTYRGLLRDRMVCLSTALTPRDVYARVGGHNPLLTQAGDYDLFLRIAMLGDRVLLLPETLVRYHLHEANASRAYGTGFRERCAILEQHLDRARRRGDRSTAAACRAGLARTREMYGSQALDEVRAALRGRRWTTAGGHLTALLTIDPRAAARAARASAARRLTCRPRADAHD